MRDYVVKQLKETVIPTLERVSGVKFDIDRLRQYMRESQKAEDDLVAVLQSAKHRPSPIDGYFGAVYYIGPIFTAFRGTPEATEYYRVLREEIEQRVARRQGPDHARRRDGARRSTGWSSKARRTGPASATSGRCSTTRARSSSPSTYAKVGGALRLRLPPRPRPTRSSRSPSTASAATPTSTCRQRIDMICQLHRRVPGRRPADQLDQELQQLLRRAAADPARGREAHRQAGRVHRDRPGRPALLLGGERQEPARELLPDDQAEARARRRARTRPSSSGHGPCAASSASTSARRPPRRWSSTRTSNILGRGITNSRSNYDTAAAIAKQEALVNGALPPVPAGAAAAPGRSNGALDEFLGQLERDFRLEQYLEQLADLEATCRRNARGREVRRRDAGRRRRADRGVPAAARRGAGAVRAGREAQVATSSATSPAASTSRPARRWRRRRASATTSCSTSSTARSSRSRTASTATRSGGTCCAALERTFVALPDTAGAARPRSRRRSRASSTRRWRRPTSSAPATAARGCRSPRSTSAPRSCATASART